MKTEYCIWKYLKDVQADVAIDIDIRVEAATLKLDFGRLKGIISWEIKGEFVFGAFKHCVFAALDCAFPA